MKRSLLFLSILLILLIFAQKSQLFRFNLNKTPNTSIEKRTVVEEDSVVTKVIEDSLPSVVTVGISATTSSGGYYSFDPTNPFAPPQPVPGRRRNIEQNIGSGFIIDADGLILTNKHVVSETSAKYTVLTNDHKKYPVEKIYRDPLNDVAILKINAPNLKPLTFGDSNVLKLGQMVLAIGTPLGQFTNTVTKGIVSGLGRGITAGSPYEGSVEKLDNVIQTDAPISSGNSGGPLINSAGQVIGVNTAVAAEGQNIGFAIPSNVLHDLVENFRKQGGSFERPYLGVRYSMIDSQTAQTERLVEGAVVAEVVADSPADRAGIQQDDIITEIDGQKIKGDSDQNLAKIISQKKVGDTVQVRVWRQGQYRDFRVALESANQ